MPDYQQTIDTAASLSAVGRYGEAVEVLDSLPQSEGESIPTLLLRARIAAQRGLFDEAESFCRQIDLLAPQGPELDAAAEIRSALRNAKGRRHLGKWLTAAVMIVFCLGIGMAYFAGRRSRMIDAREQMITSIGHQQVSLSKDVRRQEHSLRDLMDAIGQIQQSVSRIEEQQRNSQDVLDRRTQQIDTMLRSMKDRIRVLSTRITGSNRAKN